MPILMYDREGKVVVMTLEQLLPMSFGPEKLLNSDELVIGLSPDCDSHASAPSSTNGS